MKVPMRGEVWQGNDSNILYYVVAVEKHSIKCVTNNNDVYSVFSINKYDFIAHRHYVAISRIDVKDIFERVNYD